MLKNKYKNKFVILRSPLVIPYSKGEQISFFLSQLHNKTIKMFFE
jgi:hypothetical protein